MTQVPSKSDEQDLPQYAVEKEHVLDEGDEVTSKLQVPPSTPLTQDDVAVEGEDVASVSTQLSASESAAPHLTLDSDSDDKITAILVEKTVDLDLPSVSQGDFDTDESATIEGVPLLENPRAERPRPPDAGTVLKSAEGTEVVLEQTLGEQNGCVFYRAKVGEDEPPFTAVWSEMPPPEPLWSHLPDSRVVRPRCRVDKDNAAIRVFDRPRGNTVIDYLGEGDRFLPAMATLELGIELAEMLENLHGAGYALYDIDPSQIVIGRGGKVRLYAINGIFKNGALPSSMLSPYAAPEVRRRARYWIGTHSDVYTVAFLLYGLLARRAPSEGDCDSPLLQNPRVFRPECPLGIWPYLEPCLRANPAERIGHARGLLKQLQKARDRLLQEAAAVDNPPRISLEAWAETHAGLGKARRGSDQQDRALAATSESGTTGLYVIADGVSRSKYGDGAFAAEQINLAAAQRWHALEKAGEAALKMNHAQRADILAQMARTAGKKIASEVNHRHHPVPNEPNQVMSSTLVGAFVVEGEATIANLGDSRAYLIRNETIERVSIDHDRTTDALRMGLSYQEAADVRMGAALTRVVGRVLIDTEGHAEPDPFDPEIFRVRLMPNDVLVICSDGVADFAAGAGNPTPEQEQAILDCILEYEDPARAAFELVVLANRAGGYDNISCVVIAAHTI